MRTPLRQCRPPAARRSGLTIIDVLVVVGCLLLLAALMAPAGSRARGAARRLECLNNLKNLGLAVRNYATSHDNQLPLLEQPIAGRGYGWPVHLLPVLDAGAVYRELERGDPEGIAAQMFLQVFACPEDSNHFGQPGGLSYVANGGYGHFTADEKSGAVTEIGTHTPEVDFDGDGGVTDEEIDLAYATGLLWRVTDRATRHTTFDAIEAGDGMGMTLLLAENVNAGRWTSTNTMDLAVVIGLEALEFDRGPESRGPLHLKGAPLGAFAPNSRPGMLVGQSPAPSSSHSTIHIALCDGSARAISDKIDSIVYAELMTPDGRRHGQTTTRPEALQEELNRSVEQIGGIRRPMPLWWIAIIVATVLGIVLSMIAIWRSRRRTTTSAPSE